MKVRSRLWHVIFVLDLLWWARSLARSLWFLRDSSSKFLDFIYGLPSLLESRVLLCPKSKSKSKSGYPEFYCNSGEAFLQPLGCFCRVSVRVNAILKIMPGYKGLIWSRFGPWILLCNLGNWNYFSHTFQIITTNYDDLPSLLESNVLGVNYVHSQFIFRQTSFLF